MDRGVGGDDGIMGNKAHNKQPRNENGDYWQHVNVCWGKALRFLVSVSDFECAYCNATCPNDHLSVTLA
jgi:hypothetical protein